MTLRKRLESSPFLVQALGTCLALYLRACVVGNRWTVEGREALLADLREGPVLLILWHSRSALAGAFWPRRPGPMTVLHDGSPMGRIAARVKRHFGLETVQATRRQDDGSPGREIIRAARAGRSIGMVADGPRGPARQINDAAFGWAQRLDRPVWGFAFATSRQRRAQSWDRQLFPLPFGRGAVVFARIERAPHWTAAETRQALAAQLDRIAARADALIGLPPGD